MAPKPSQDKVRKLHEEGFSLQDARKRFKADGLSKSRVSQLLAYWPGRAKDAAGDTANTTNESEENVDKNGKASGKNAGDDVQTTEKGPDGTSAAVSAQADRPQNKPSEMDARSVSKWAGTCNLLKANDTWACERIGKATLHGRGVAC